MYLHQDDGPTEYPLAMNGLGLPSGNTAVGNVRPGDPAPDQSRSQWIWNVVAATTPLLMFLPSFATTDDTNAAPTAATPTAYAKNMQSAQQAVSDPRIAALWKRVGDLDSFGLLTATEKGVVSDYIRTGKFQQADEILSENENGAAVRKKPSPSSGLDRFIPAGYRIRDQLIPNVPNYVLYGSVLILGSMTAIKSMGKR